MTRPGTAYNKSMGGVGIAMRNNRYINVLNPAAVTARDSLAFMMDFSLYNDNKIFSQSGIKSVKNIFNVGDIVLSFPIWKSSAMAVGIIPYSDTGFGYSFDYTDPNVIGQTGNISYDAKGNGSIYKLFVTGGVTFFKHLSIGAQFDFYFGNLDKNYNTTIADASYNSIQNNTNLQMRAYGGTFGVQYERALSTKSTLALGATYSTKAKMKGDYKDSRFSVGSAQTDTLYYKADTMGVTKSAYIAGQLGVGVTYKYADKWMLSFDYTYSDWSHSGIDQVSGFGSSSPFTTAASHSFRAGFEIIPNRNDIRYYMRRVAYRAGAYYKTENFLYQGHRVNAMGLTVGATFPITRWYNGITVGLELGKRGSTSGGRIRENFFNVSVGINIFDIWFQKPHYD